MVKATVDIEGIERVDLKTLPEGFVALKRLPYGLVIQRRSMMRMQVEAGKGRGKGFAGELALADKDFTLFDFKHCIIDHNLEDETGRKLNFQNEHDVNKLDPRVGQEIEEAISNLNDLDEEDDELGN